MKNLNYKKAFTLVELLTVVVIIGMIASVALVTLKDTGEVKAKVHTQKVLSSIKDAIVYKDSPIDFYPLFLNDFGAMPPNPYFLINEEASNNNFNSKFVDGKLYKFRVTDMQKQDDTIVYPAPFMETCSGEGTASYTCEDKDIDGDGSDDTIDTSITTSAIYAGYQRSYLQNTNGNKSVLDGWSNEAIIELNLNISETDANTNPFFNAKSYGSDRMKTQTVGEEYLRDEYNEFADKNDIKSFYSDDIDTGSNYGQYDFIPKGISAFDIDISTTTTTTLQDNSKVAVLIYTPMLYYVENSDTDINSDGVQDSYKVYNAKQAKNSDASGIYGNYIPFVPYADGFDEDWASKNLSWQVGIAKYSFIFEDTDGDLTSDPIDGFENVIIKLNDKDIVIDGSTIDMTTADFFKDITNPIKIIYNIPNTTPPPDTITVSSKINYDGQDDEDNPFYMMAGKKYIVVLSYDGTTWKNHGTTEIEFKPNEDIPFEFTE